VGKIAAMRIMTWLKRIGKFFREVRAEVKKVTWVGRKELITSAIVVIFVVAISVGYIGVIDFAISKVLEVLIQ
jgi:preprotein translocase subunit SecE